jgi:uncharacterized membrane protein YraQ (UPF0718 family)
MVRKELVIGDIVARFLGTQVPTAFWRSLCVTGHGFWSSLEKVVLGPFLAIISFVCSVGNVPLAAALWQGAIRFGGVVSFVFADLITLPLLSIYRKYFGTAISLRILATFWATMSIAGLAVEYLFTAVDLSDPNRSRLVVHTGFAWHHTSVLNILALGAFAVSTGSTATATSAAAATPRNRSAGCRSRSNTHRSPRPSTGSSTGSARITANTALPPTQTVTSAPRQLATASHTGAARPTRRVRSRCA